PAAEHRLPPMSLSFSPTLICVVWNLRQESCPTSIEHGRATVFWQEPIRSQPEQVHVKNLLVTFILLCVVLGVRNEPVINDVINLAWLHKWRSRRWEKDLHL